MRYILTRIIMLIIAVIAINYISNYIGEISHHKFGYLFAKIAFYRMLLAIFIISLGIFSYEAYRFNKQNKRKEKNISLALVGSILLITLMFSGLILEFVF